MSTSIGTSNLVGCGAVNASTEGRWSNTPLMNASPILEIPYWLDPSDALKTLIPLLDKLICTLDPQPYSSNEYLNKKGNKVSKALVHW